MMLAARLYVVLRPLAGYRCSRCGQGRLVREGSLHAYRKGWFDVYGWPCCGEGFRKACGHARLETVVPGEVRIRT